MTDHWKCKKSIFSRSIIVRDCCLAAWNTWCKNFRKQAHGVIFHNRVYTYFQLGLKAFYSILVAISK